MTNSSLPPSVDAPVSHIDLRDPSEDVDELEEQPLLRRRSGRRLQPTFTPPTAEDAPTLPGSQQGPSHSTSVVAYPSSPPQRNGHDRQTDEVKFSWLDINNHALYTFCMCFF